MNKLQFLNQLRVKLEILSDKEIKDIMDEYSDTIDQKVQEGKTEEEAVKDFGDINELAQEILQAYKIDPNKKSKKGSDLADQIGQVITDIVDYLVTFFSTIFKDLSVEGFTRTMVLIGVGLILIILLKIPFIFIERLFEAVFRLVLPYAFARPISIIVNIFLGFVHIFISVMLVVSFIRIGVSGEEINYKNLISKPLTEGFNFTKKENKETNNETKSNEKKENEEDDKKINATMNNDEKTNERTIEDNKKADVISKNTNDKGRNVFVTILIWCIRLFAFLFLLPFWTFIICIAIFIGIGIFLIFQGFQIWGLVLISIGGLGLLSAIVTFISNILWYMKKTNFKFLMVQVILSSIILGGGIVVCIEEFANANVINVSSDNIEQYLDTETYTMSTDLQANVEYRFYSDVNYIKDSSLIDTIVVEAVLPKGYSINIEDYGNEDVLYINTFRRNDFKERQLLFKFIYDGMKNNEFYNFDESDITLDVRIPESIFDDIESDEFGFIYEK